MCVPEFIPILISRQASLQGAQMHQNCMLIGFDPDTSIPFDQQQFLQFVVAFYANVKTVD